MAGRQSPDRNETGANHGAAGTRRIERLARILPDHPAPASLSLPQTLEQLALLATIRGDSADEAVFTRAAALVRTHGIDSDVNLGDLLAQPPADADADALQRLRHMYESAAWVLLESAIADLPMDLRWLFESGAVTVEQLAVLHRALGVTSASDLRAAVFEGAIRRVPGLNESIERAIASALPDLRRAVPRLALGRAVALAEPILERLRSAPGVVWASPGGSLRRGEDTVGDVELVAATTLPADAIAELLRLPDIIRCLHRSERRVYLLLERVQVGVRLPEPANAGATLLQATGSSAHLTSLREHAKTTRWRLTMDGLRGVDGTLRACSTEEEIYATLGLPFIPPEIRNGAEEIEAAKNGALPTLLSRSDIRGDLHMHTDFSDGRDTVEAMVLMCRRLGYEVHGDEPTIRPTRPLRAICRSTRSRSRPKRLSGCASTIPISRFCTAARSTSSPTAASTSPIVFSSVTVLASLHERAGDGRDLAMNRYSAAMKHPLVTLITHPTNRLVPHRPGYDLDYDRLFAMAVETRTLVEIDGAPSHLDLDGACRGARSRPAPRWRRYHHPSCSTRRSAS